MARKKIETIICEKIAPYTLNERGKSDLSQIVRKYPYDLLIECIDIGITNYIRFDEDGVITRESVQTFLSKLGGIAFNKSRSPIEQEIYHLKNKGKKQFSYWNNDKADELLRDYVSALSCNWNDDKKSYKSRKRIDVPREDWVIFENTQEAIIDKQTFATVQRIREAKRRPTDMGEMSPLSGLVYCADCGKKMYLCRCTTMKQKEYFNCSSYRKNLKRTCTSHQITVEALNLLIQDDLRRTINFATNQNERFLQALQTNAETKTKKELKENQEEIKSAEERIEKLDKIIESLYEDKVEEKISEERYLKMSDTYESEQLTLNARVKTLKSEIEKAKEQSDKILSFMILIHKYSSFEDLTPEILRSFIDRVIVHEKTKVDGHYRQTVEIIYNFVGAIDKPHFADEIN